MISKSHCEYLRLQARDKFQPLQETWIECGKWGSPHRTKWLNRQQFGKRNQAHIVDSTHIIALRSCVAGFLEGNTSASRPWYRHGVKNPEANLVPANKRWLERLTRLTLKVLSSSNFYHEAGQFYYDYHVFMTGTHYIDELPDGLFFHTLIPGSYYLINDGYGEAVVLIREFSMSVKALVNTYGVKKSNGHIDWSNFSSTVKKLYEDQNYTFMVDCVHEVYENPEFDPSEPVGGKNRQWVSVTYELDGKGSFAQDYQPGSSYNSPSIADPAEANRFLKISYSKRKPFVAGRSPSNGNFEYGERGATLDALGLIKSLNKKAISKDQALEQMLRPALQGPANLRKSYITSAPNSYVPLDATALREKGVRSIFEVNPAVVQLTQDVEDIRNQVNKLYFADYLTHLMANPKTRTAAEVDAIVQEQQVVIGPNLQSLNWTYNEKIVDFVTDYVLDTDSDLGQPPPGLRGQFLRPEFISIFAQAQRAADLPSIDRYIRMAIEVGQMRPEIWDKANLDRLADLYEDRLYLPEGLNRPQAQVEAMRQQAQAAAERKRALEETLPAVAGAAKDVGLNIKGVQG